MMGCQKIIAFSLSYSYLTFSICFKLICISWKEGCYFTVEGAEKLTLFVRYYDNPEHMKELGGIDIGKYVAGGIVVFNLDTKQVKWIKDLDLSTDMANFRPHIYSSPNVVDWMVMETWTSLLELHLACSVYWITTVVPLD